MRRFVLLALLLLLPLRASAGAWGLDVGLSADIGMAQFSGAPSGVPAPGTDALYDLLAPSVTSASGAGLVGQGGFELALHHKRRFMASLQVLWRGQSLSLVQSFGPPLDLERKELWEWSGLCLPLELSYGWPLSTKPGWSLLGRAGAGAWYQKNSAWSKHLSAGASNLERPWSGPPDDWGPLVGLGLDWIALPSGRRVCSFEIRAMQGMAMVDPAGGAEKSVWTLGGVLSVPVAMWVL